MDRNLEILQKQFSVDNIAHRYQQAVKYFVEGADKSEYKVFVEMTMKKDISALAHTLLQRVYSFEEYMERLHIIIGYDLMIQETIRKNNGKSDKQNQA